MDFTLGRRPQGGFPFFNITLVHRLPLSELDIVAMLYHKLQVFLVSGYTYQMKLITIIKVYLHCTALSYYIAYSAFRFTKVFSYTPEIIHKLKLSSINKHIHSII